MGNSNVKKLNKKKMGGPAIAAMIISILIIVAFLISLIASSGLFLRMQNGASSENFKVNGSMMSYFTNSYYQSWYSQYYYYIYLGYVDFDPSASLKEQYVDKDKTQTYYDFFAEAAKTQVTQILKYCEAAKADSAVDFSKLESEAKAAADESIKALEASAKSMGYTTDAYIRTNFGENVTKNDVYDSIVLEGIASSYYEIIYDRFYDAVTDADKNTYFGENLAEFVHAAYLTYAIESSVAVPTVTASDYKGGAESKAYLKAVEEATKNIKADDYEGGEESEEYKQAVAAAIAEAGIVASDYEGGEGSPKYKAALAEAYAKAKEANEAQMLKDKEIIDKLAVAESEEEFKRIFLEHKYDINAFNAAYVTAIKDLTDVNKPSEAEQNEFKESIKDAVINAVIEGKTDITDEEEDEAEESAEDKDDDTTTWEDIKKDLPATIIKSLTSTLTAAEKETEYALKSDVEKWLFGGVKAQFGIEYGEGEDAEGTSAKLGETKAVEEITNTDTGKYKLTVYYVTEEAHRDETVLRDVGHILFGVGNYGDFKTADDAKAKADEIYAELLKKANNGIISKEDFEAIGKENNDDSSVFYENIGKGQMVEEFEAWLFAATKVGEMGMVESEYGWHIMYYGGETENVAWSFAAHGSVTNEKLEKWFEELPYEITVNDGIFESILD